MLAASAGSNRLRFLAQSVPLRTLSEGLNPCDRQAPCMKAGINEPMMNGLGHGAEPGESSRKLTNQPWRVDPAVFRRLECQ